MAAVSESAHTATTWALGFIAVVIIAATAQWFMPARTVQPIAERFLCSSGAIVTPANSASQGGILSKVECMEGLRRNDVTMMAFVILAIPSALILAAVMVLARRLLSPKVKTRIQRAAA